MTVYSSFLGRAPSPMSLDETDTSYKMEVSSQQGTGTDTPDQVATLKKGTEQRSMELSKFFGEEPRKEYSGSEEAHLGDPVSPVAAYAGPPHALRFKAQTKISRARLQAPRHPIVAASQAAAEVTRRKRDLRRRALLPREEKERLTAQRAEKLRQRIKSNGEAVEKLISDPGYVMTKMFTAGEEAMDTDKEGEACSQMTGTAPRRQEPSYNIDPKAIDALVAKAYTNQHMKKPQMRKERAKLPRWVRSGEFAYLKKSAKLSVQDAVHKTGLFGYEVAAYHYEDDGLVEVVEELVAKTHAALASLYDGKDIAGLTEDIQRVQL